MIAMALVNNPKLLIADEPTTALDVTVQSEILTLLKTMQREFNMAIILITHDLGVVASIADRINVMYAGRLVEQGTVDEIFYQSVNPYTLGLLGSIPRVDQSVDRRLKTIAGQPPSLIALPSGCAFEPRCDFASHVPNGLCKSVRPESSEKTPGHFARCHLSASQVFEISTMQKAFL
jgi:peptide/nickel transport system ATP-binding protein